MWTTVLKGLEKEVQQNECVYYRLPFLHNSTTIQHSTTLQNTAQHYTKKHNALRTCGAVEGELADGDSHAVRAQVTLGGTVE